MNKKDNLLAEQSRAEQSRAEQSRAEQSRAEQSRAVGLDILKTLCAFLIVCIHISFPGEFGQYFVVLCRAAVPIFFIITGFFYHNTVSHNRHLYQIKKIFFMLISANVLYLIWNIVLVIYREGNFNAILMYIEECFSITSVLKFLVLNVSPFSGHLWYLGALLYTLIVFALFDKLHIRKVLYYATPFLLLVDLVFGKYSLVLFGREFPYILLRNFAFVGIPCFSIGILLSEHIKQISDGIKKYSFLPTLLSATFLCGSIIERWILVKMNLNATRDNYVCTIFLSISLFLTFYCYQPRRKIGEWISRIGREDSSIVYIIHPIFITICEAIFLPISSNYWYVAPIIVFLISVLFAMIYKLIKLSFVSMVQNRH